MSTIRRSISTKVPDIGRSDQRMSAPTWNRLTTPLPRCSPVTSGVPSSSEAQLLVASTASGSASTWRLTVMSFGTCEARERAVGGERGQMLRLFPGQAAAEAAAAAAQLDRHQIVIGLRETGTGEAHQHAALIDPGVEALADFRRQRADIGQHDHRQLLIEELRDHLLRRAAVAEPHVGERRQRAGEIEGRGQQRLRGVAGRARDDADRAPPPALVEQLHGAGGALAGDFQPRDVVAQFDRQIERGFGLAVLRPERVTRLADRRALGVDRAHHAGGNAAVGAQHLHRHLRGGVFGGDQRQRRRRAAFEDRQRAIADGLARGLPGIRLPRPVSTPSVSQAISASPVVFRKRSSAGSVSTRSTE